MGEVELSLERYHQLLDSEKEVARLQSRINRMNEDIKNLYIIESVPNQMRGGETVYVRIDKLNLLGLMGINLKHEGISQILFEFYERGIFLSEERGLR